MIIVMTGATGLIGRHLAEELQRRGHEVRALSRHEGARYRLDAPAEAFEGARALVHLAGAGIADARWTESRKRELIDSRVETARALIPFARDLDVVVSASGIGYFGDRGDAWLDESAGPGDDFLARLCVRWEAAAREITARRHVQARFGVVIAPDGGFLKQVVPLFKRLGASRLGDGKQFFSWIERDDVVRILAAMVDEEEFEGAYNVCAPNPVTNAELTERLKVAVGAWPAPPAPRFALRLLYGELADALLYSQRARPARLLEQGWTFACPDLSSALARTFSTR